MTSIDILICIIQVHVFSYAHHTQKSMCKYTVTLEVWSQPLGSKLNTNIKSWLLVSSTVQ